MAEDKRFPVPAAVRPAVMTTPPKTKWKAAEQIMGKYVLQLTATFTTTLEHARGWRSSRFRKTTKGMHILMNLLDM